MAELFITFFKLGLFTIGGGVAMIPILRDIMVNDKKWFSDEEMIDIISICQSLPGVIAINMATYVGFKRRGLIGSLVATVGVTIPSFVIILLIAKGIDVIGGNPYVQGALGGLRAAAVGLVIVAVWQIAKTVVHDAASAAAAIVSFVAISFLDVSVVWVIIAFLALGVARAFYVKAKSGGEGQ